MEFPKKYSPKDFEDLIYQKWEKEGKFKPKDSTTWNNFYIPMPPPNVTSKLHIGHSVMLTLEDIMVRYHRMKWDSSLLLPWTDHAWISTQIKVEEKLAAEWKSKHNISREEFLKECWDWNDNYWSQIQNQFRKMWTSCDWSKEKFTFEPTMNEKVNKAFVSLYKKWLIYRWEYMVNYDPVLNTVISDQEVIYKEEKWKLYYITYFVSWSDNEIVVATTRPETLLWDVAVAVNPKDKRFKKLLKWWRWLILPILNTEIPLVADDMVDMDFWTWAVKITPAHDPNDFQLARRHNLPLDKVVLWKDWKMTKVAWIFAWQDYMTARQNIVELLKSKWNLIKTEEHTSKVWYWERSHVKIETIISTQWFVKIDPIVKKVIHWYKKKEYEIIPNRYNKVFEDWIYNLRDWCISRQLIWWHQIPIWYTKDWDIICAENEELAYNEAKEKFWDNVELTRDKDVLDTWFSSALWPFAVLDFDINSDSQSDLYNKFYPASVLETWHDIIFFWVVRMLLFWYEFTWITPFKKIYLHWLVRDKLWRKMSKSLWNWVDPIDMIEKYWTDALRLTLSIWNTPWNDLKFDEENVNNNMLFINKLWNASRFVYMNIENEEKNLDTIEKSLIKNYDNLFFHEKWILSRIRYLSDLVSESMEKYSFSEAGQELQAFTKNEFCDYYIEEFKITKDTSKYWKKVIIYVIWNLLKLLHPYIPFVSAEIYEKLWFLWDIIESKWPVLQIPQDSKLEKEKDIIIWLIKEIRVLRIHNNIPPSEKVWVKIYVKNKNLTNLFNSIDIISWIVKAEYIEKLDNRSLEEWLAYWVTKDWIDIYLDTTNAIDINSEIKRIKENIEDSRDYIAILDKKLLNESFVKRAPESLVREEMMKKEQAKQKLKKLEEKLAKFKK